MKIIERQQTWALQSSVNFEHGYCVDTRANVPWLSDETYAEFLAADGEEFGKGRQRPKIAALHSSSALAVNVFGYWRARDKAPLAAALGYPARQVKDLSFERKFPTGVGPRSPNIDVVLTLEGGALLAIESKFTEWTGSAGRKSLREAYLPPDIKRWSARGLPGAQRAAETYRAGAGFNRLDVPQLLKHMLGLSSMKPATEWHLILLWHRCDETIALEMDEEFRRFRDLLGEDHSRVSSLTYQDFWDQLKPLLASEHVAYASYLGARYF